ncbi:hypothetical protein CO172_01670 [Candidatus Uhrbacteria bacterium CG_4_9_14_3_um_filter_36_7]|uniref:LytR family transcriptional regulator n=1 Tax=Candidatus Uhrbacteria bacterium CG_4_9_14_3_um_filter_36_7 TaxID=1975033 RepID=A0A2M7XHN8_9BACT|nr:MAG: hypothetical protein CO172_01670 [Candidatus Uhrbacteria bacterium CG_4_9_14_3_um_filter_36_7]
MQPIRIDLLRAKYQLETQRRKPSIFFVYGFLILFVIMALIGTIFSYQVASSHDASETLSNLSLFSTVRSLILPHPGEIQGEKDDRINILLLGVGGSGHDGPELSDTIIFMSVKPSEKKMGLLSIPRDLTVPIPNYGWRKINHVNAFAEAENSGSGPLATQGILEDLFKQPIHYYVKIDFSGFAQLIDDIGGVDIYVDPPFVDTQYPTSNHLYQTIIFQKGWQHMDGNQALMYVRSRHGNNGQGSDFSRSRRQQQVLLAMKEKIVNVSTLLHPLRMNRLLETLGDHLSTNITTWELIRFAKLMDVGQDLTFYHKVLDVSEGSPLYATSMNGAYVILPKENDWTQIQQLVANLLLEETSGGSLDQISSNDITTSYSQTSSSSTAIETPPEKSIRIEVQNGTTITGLAAKAAQILQGQGFEITTIGNAKQPTYSQTIIYDFTDNKESYQTQRDALQAFFKAQIQNTSSEWSYESLEKEDTPPPVDFLIILGTNNQDLL